MASFRNIVACICLIPFLAASFMPVGLDLQMKVCPHGEWGITVTSCSCAEISHPSADREHKLSPGHCCSKSMGIILACGGDSHSKSEYFHLERNNPRYLSLPVDISVPLSQSDFPKDPDELPVSGKSRSDLHPDFLRTVSLLI
jgi:hypothetical protein